MTHARDAGGACRSHTRRAGCTESSLARAASARAARFVAARPEASPRAKRRAPLVAAGTAREAHDSAGRRRRRARPAELTRRTVRRLADDTDSPDGHCLRGREHASTANAQSAVRRQRLHAICAAVHPDHPAHPVQPDHPVPARPSRPTRPSRHTIEPAGDADAEQPAARAPPGERRTAAAATAAADGNGNGSGKKNAVAANIGRVWDDLAVELRGRIVTLEPLAPRASGRAARRSG